jgi:large subunit ribosomal protein L23
MSLHPNEVLLAPVVTEKAYAGVEVGRYAFRIHPDAHKTQVRQAVEELFDVRVERVNISMVRPKPKRRGTHRGTRPGWKKAIVQLRQGDTIELFGGVHV